MAKARTAGALMFPLLLLSTPMVAAGLGDRCLTGAAPTVVNDASQIRAVRAVVDAACVCSSFDGSKNLAHGDYVRCAAGIIRSQVDAGGLRAKCGATVKKYYSKSTCGEPANRNAQTCVQRSSRTGKVTCAVRSSTRSDGVTPTNWCVDRPGRATRVACLGYTHCIDAADTDGNLVIAAPADTGACALPPTPVVTTTPTPSPTPTPTSSATSTPTTTLAPVATPTASGCVASPSAIAELEANRARWGAAGIATYDLDYQRSCACPGPGDATVLVSDGDLVSVLDAGSGEEIEGPPTGAFGFNSVDGLFDVIAAAIDVCAPVLEVEYDPELGYPTLTRIDLSAGAIGDEVEIRISDLHVAAAPAFPFALGECHFDPQCAEQSCMPYLSAVPSPGSNAKWTAFFEAWSISSISRYFPVPCGGEGVKPRVRVGDMISVGEGQTSPLLFNVECVIDSGQTEFTIPLIPCDQVVSSAEVVGFARIGIDGVVLSGTPKGISLHGLWGN